jgi:hypothetical protein
MDKKKKILKEAIKDGKGGCGKHGGKGGPGKSGQVVNPKAIASAIQNLKNE